MHCSINSSNFLNLFQFILINSNFYYLFLLTFIVKDVFYKNAGILFLFYHFIIFFILLFLSFLFFLFYYFLSLFFLSFFIHFKFTLIAKIGYIYHFAVKLSVVR